MWVKYLMEILWRKIFLAEIHTHDLLTHGVFFLAVALLTVLRHLPPGPKQVASSLGTLG